MAIKSVIEIAIFLNKLHYVLKPKATHRGRIKYNVAIGKSYLEFHICNCECTLM